MRWIKMLLRRKKITLDVIGSMDSGQGSCLILRDGGLVVALDCGTSSTNGNGFSHRTTERVVAEMVSAYPKFLVVSHFHHDHWGALPAIVEEYRRKRIPLPAIVATDITWQLLERYVFENPSLSKSMLVKLGFRGKSDRIRLIPNRHSVPGSAGVLVLGTKNVLYTSDCWAIDLPNDLPKIDVLVICSTGAHHDKPREDKEMKIRENILALTKEAIGGGNPANVYVAMFSTQLERAMWLESEVEKTVGYLPMVNGTSLSKNLSLLRPEVRGYHSRKVVLTTGAWAQGQEHWDSVGSSALVRLSQGTDKRCQLKKGDMVILSASIPVWSPPLTAQIKIMCERISALGVRLIVDVSAPKEWESFAERREVHTGGHGNMPEVAGMIDKIKPKKVLPFHASVTAREKVARYCNGKGISVISMRQGSQITL